MEIGRAFGGPFKDPSWFGKVLIGALVGIVPILNFALLGYGLEYVRNVSRGSDMLPEWSGFGRYWVRGLSAAVAGFVYAVPAVAIAMLGILPPLMASASSSVSQGDVSPILAALSGTLMFLVLALVYVIAVSVLVHGALVHYAMSDEFGALFRFKDIWAKVSSGTGYWTAWVASYLFGFIAGVVGGAIGFVLGLIPCLGQLLAVPVGMLVGVVCGLMIQHGFGQYAARAYGPSAAGSGVTAPFPPVAPFAPAYAPPPPSPSSPVVPSAPFRPSMPRVPGGVARTVAAAPIIEDEEPAPPMVPVPVVPVPVVPAPVAPAPRDLGTVVVPRPKEQPADVEPEAEAESASAASETSATDSTAVKETRTPAKETPPLVAAARPAPPAEPQKVFAPAPDSAAVAAPAVAPTPVVPAPAPRPSSPRSETVIERPGGATGARLYVVKGSGVGQSFRLPHADMKLGRDESAGIRLDDGKVSREHAKIQYRDGAYRVLDMGSSNGTFVNEEKIVSPHRLEDKDHVRIGDTVFEYRAED